ncbi:MAG: beta strand repeat-containing protein [Gaiellaceae bacterium]
MATKTVTGALAGSVTMEATAGGLTTGTLGAFTVVHGAAAQIALTGSTANLTSGAGRLLTATIQDAAGNTVTSDNTTVVAFAKQSGAGTVTGTGNATASSGVATKTVTGALAGSVTIEATAAGLTTGTLGAFTVVHGAATQISLTGSTADLTSGANRVLTATIQDAAGNTVTSDSSTVIAFTKASGAGTVTGTGNATASNGVATKTVTGALVGSVTMEATSAGLTAGALGAFDVVHGAAAEIVLTGSTADLTSGANRVLTATLQDAAGNTVTSDNSTVVAFAKAAGAGTVTGSGNATSSNGVATKTITGALVGSVTMEATAAGLTTGTLGAFTVVHGAAAQISLTGSTADLTSGANRVLTATIQDAAGNTVTSDNSTVVAFAKASGAGTVTGSGNATASNGVATKTITGALAGSVTTEATSAGLTTGALGAFDVVHGAGAQIQLTDSGSTASGDNHTLTATIVDAAGNTVASDSSTVVTFAKTGGAGTVTGLGNATASNGVATKMVANAASGQIDLDAQGSGLVTGTASYTIAPGSASTATSTISASPTSIVADGSSTSAITVQLKDVAGNDLTGSGGVVALGLVGAGSLSAVTDNGDGTYSATLTSPVMVGSATVTGTLNAAAMAATAGVSYAHGPAAQIALAESGSTVAGNAHTLTATIEDANGNTVTSDSSTAVAFAKTGGPGSVTGLGTATASNGVATKVVTNMLAGQIDLDAQSAGLADGSTSYTIAIGPVSAASSDSTVAAAPATVYANGADSSTITVTLRDAGGNPVPGKTVTLDQGAASSAISGGGSTNAAGVVTFSVSDATVETVVYTATDTTDSITLADDATVDFTFADSTAPTNAITLGSAAGASLSGTTLYYNGASGGSFTLSSAVADAGAGPASATYPALARPGWAHGAETVSAPAGGPYASSAFTFAAGSSGDFTYDVTASDAWAPANTSQTTLNLTEDSTAPAASILCDGAGCSAGWYTSSPVSVTLAAPDAGAGLDQIRYTTDGSTPTILTGTVYAGAFNVAAEGVTTINYLAFDRVGNDTGVQTQAIRIDTIAPDTTIDSAPAGATQDTTPTFAFSSPEAGSTFEVRIDGGAWTTETSPITLGPLAESTYTFEVRATDPAGNVDATPASFVFTVDTTPANTTITSSPPAASSSTNASFSFTASDAGPGFECRLDGGAFADCTSPAGYAGLSEASHTFEVRAEDAAGNLDATPSTHTWTVDVTAPDTSFLSTPSTPSANPTPTFGLGSTESPATFECDLDGGGWAPCATPYTTPALGDGPHTLKARAADAAGNVDATEITHAWTVDATAPTGSITAPADGTDVGGTIVLASNSADGGSGVATVVFQRSPAGVGTWTSQAASWDTTQQPDGDYDVRVVTTDNAGNTFTSAPITVTVDNTEPSLSVVAPNPVNIATADPATVGANATDDGTGVANVRFDQCAEDSAACDSDSWVLLAVDTGAPYEASWPIPSDGPRLLRVRATDNAGKQKTELVLVTIDRIRPTGSLTAPAVGANLRGSSVALTATASDTAPGTVNTVTFQRSPAGAGTWTDVTVDPSAPYTGTLDTTGLADGLYDLRVFTTDAAGNAEAAPATIQVRVDNTLPTGSVTAPAAGADVRGTIALTSDSADAGGSGVDTVQFQRSPAGTGSWTNQAASFDTTSVTDGQYDLRVVTTDNAGNTFTSAALTVRVDNTLPTGSLTAPASGAEIGVAPVSLTSDSADTGSGVATVVFERSPAGANTWTATASSWNTASGPDAVADGAYDLRVQTTDNAGNGFTSAVVTVLVDHTAPATTASLAPGTPSNAPVTVSFSADDGTGSGVSVISYSVDGGGLQSGAAVVIPAPGDHSNDGAHLVEFFSTDEVGNVETTKDVTVVIDTTAPTGTGGDPGDYLRGIANLSYSTTATDVSSVQFEFSPEGANAWSAIGLADVAPPYEASWNTTLVADGPYDLRALVTDTTGNVASTLLPGLPKTVDNAAPVGSVTAPLAGGYVSGSIFVDASGSDGAVPPASGVSAVRFEVQPSGAGAYSVFGTQTTPVVGSTYRQALDTTALADGPADVRVVVTDVAGNETTSAVTTINVDNDAPVLTLDDPGAAAGSSIDLTASSSADTTDVTFRYRPVGSGAAGIAIGSDGTAPFEVTWTTAAAAEQEWELIAVATDGGGNVTTSAPRVVLVDRTVPTGSVTAPASGAVVGGPAVALAATGADAGGSGVTLVEWQVKEFGAAVFTTVASDGTAPFSATWNSTTVPDGAAEIRALVTDAAGNVRTTAVVPVTIDSTGPSVTFTDPGAVLTGTIALGATTGGGAVRVQFAVSPADAGTWTQIAEDTGSPFGADFDTAALADGLYDLRAIGFDSLGNPSAPSLREDVRLDNTAPQLVSSAPADGSVSTSANQIVLTASEPVTAPGALLDGAAAPAPGISGNDLTFNTGALADGLHVLSGELEDASGTRVPFRVAVTIESTPSADPPPVERSITASGDFVLTVPGGLVTVRMPQSAWPTPPTPQDYILVLRVDAGAAGAGFAPGTQIVDVTARWALAGTFVTDFEAPIEVIFSYSGGTPVLPGVSQDGSTWRMVAPLAGASLPASRPDGFSRSGSDVHVWTRHLTHFGLMLDGEAPTAPRDLAGVVAGDGLTLRWVPGTDSSEQLGNVVLYVNGEGYREFGPTEFEAKLGAFAAGDTRSFTLAQKDAAGNMSAQTAPLRAVPQLAGRSLADATAALGAAGFAVGGIREQAAATVPPGTVIEPSGIRLALASTPIDLVVARGTPAPQTRLAFSVAGSKRLTLKKRKQTFIPVRINLSKPAAVTATLRDAKKHRLYSWKLRAKAGANIVKLRLPSQIRRPGTYSLTWVARAGTETVSRTIKIKLVGRRIAQVRPKRSNIEIVLAGETPPGEGLRPGKDGTPRRVTAAAGADQTFALVSSDRHQVGVVVVDADALGTRFIADLRTVFPSVRVIAISREPARRALALRAGAVRALPRSTTAKQLAKAIALVSGR